ncbi:MAG: hypothetical protein Q8L76_04835, partial [Cypionkella sp.]|nr:hypothetical protein [Cypionkella sp.]
MKKRETIGSALSAAGQRDPDATRLGKHSDRKVHSHAKVAEDFHDLFHGLLTIRCQSGQRHALELGVKIRVSTRHRIIALPPPRV